MAEAPPRIAVGSRRDVPEHERSRRITAAAVASSDALAFT